MVVVHVYRIRKQQKLKLGVNLYQMLCVCPFPPRKKQHKNNINIIMIIKFTLLLFFLSTCMSLYCIIRLCILKLIIHVISNSLVLVKKKKKKKKKKFNVNLERDGKVKAGELCG